METAEKGQPKQNIRLERIFGIILLIPPTIGAILFLLNLLSENAGTIPKMSNLSSDWTGRTDIAYSQEVGGGGGGGGYTSAAPIYLGLMSIAGALLLKGTDKKQA